MHHGGRERVATALERTLVIVKPDGVQRGLIGEILGRWERRGLKIVALEFGVLKRENVEEHYAEHAGKGFYAGLVDYMTSGPSVTAILEGPKAIKIVRDTNGSTKPWEALPGTIRGDFALETGRNLVHASDSEASAAREINIFFGGKEFPTFARDTDAWIFE
jgi:nucleoside-diphosphate kinase